MTLADGGRSLLEAAGPLQLYRIVHLILDDDDGTLITDYAGPVPMTLPDGTPTMDVVLGVDCRPVVDAGRGPYSFVACSVRGGRVLPVYALPVMDRGDAFCLGGPALPAPPGVGMPPEVRAAIALSELFGPGDLRTIAAAAAEGPRVVQGAGGLVARGMRGEPWAQLVEVLEQAARIAAGRLT